MIVLLLTVMAPAITGAQEPAATAWAQAVALVNKSQLWVAGSSDITMEQLGRDGETRSAIRLNQSSVKVDSRIEVTVSFESMSGGFAGAFPGPGAGRAPRGGSDNVAPGRAGRPLAGGPGAGFEALREAPANPFAPGVQDTVVIEATGRIRTIGGIDATEHSIDWNTDDGSRFSGTVWLTQATHAPLRLEVTGDVPDEDVRDLQVTITYETLGDIVAPARMVVLQSVRSGLFSTDNTRMTVSFEDYFKTDGTEELIVRGLPGTGE